MIGRKRRLQAKACSRLFCWLVINNQRTARRYMRGSAAWERKNAGVAHEKTGMGKTAHQKRGRSTQKRTDRHADAGFPIPAHVCFIQHSAKEDNQTYCRKRGAARKKGRTDMQTPVFRYRRMYASYSAPQRRIIRHIAEKGAQHAEKGRTDMQTPVSRYRRMYASYSIPQKWIIRHTAPRWWRQ